MLKREVQPSPQTQTRLKKIRSALAESKLDALLVSDTLNRFYLTGWPGDAESGQLLVTLRAAFMITDSRYAEHAGGATTGFTIVETNEGVGPVLRDLVAKERIERLAFESHALSVFNLKRIKKFVKVRLMGVAHLIESLRATKEPGEINRIKRSCEIAAAAFKRILGLVKPGISELEIAWQMEKFMREAGAQRLAWDSLVVAAGSHASMAHWAANETKIKKGDLVLIDYGCVYRGYHCDISRVVFVGKPQVQQRKIYEVVLAAQELGASLVKGGRSGASIDKKIRAFLERRVDPKYVYKHSIGHGIGLQVHELPYVSIRRKNKLVAGNVITIEPGVYIPGWGGVRIEDTLAVTTKGATFLTSVPKKISEITL